MGDSLQNKACETFDRRLSLVMSYKYINLCSQTLVSFALENVGSIVALGDVNPILVVVQITKANYCNSHSRQFFETPS